MIKELMKSIREYKKDSIMSPLMVTMEVIMEVIIPVLMARLIDFGIEAQNLGYIWKMGILLAVSAAVLVLMVITGKMSRLEAFFHSGDNTASVYMSLINPWFVIFAVFCGAEILFSLSAL